MNLHSIYKKKDEIITKQVADEYILVPIQNKVSDMDNIYTLNQTGGFIWEQINGKKTIGQIIETIANEFDTNKETASKDVFSFFRQVEEMLILI